MSFKIGIAQVNSVLGDVQGNIELIKRKIIEAQAQAVGLLIFPEMVLTGYPLRDLIFRSQLLDQVTKGIEFLAPYAQNISVIVGTITAANKERFPLTPFYNSAVILQNGTIKTLVHKRLLPNYDIFDERRYFAPGDNFDPISCEKIPIGIEICEDLWDDPYPMKVTPQLKQNGAKFLVNINASPYHIGKPELRDRVISSHAKVHNIPIIYVNLVGGQDEVVFDGRSVIVDEMGRVIFRAPAFEEGLFSFNFDWEHLGNSPEVPAKINQEEDLFKALVLNLRDYYTKTGTFKGIILGMSGGVDSSFTAAVACEAIGAENVTGLLLPSRFSSEHSINDALQLCQNLGCQSLIMPIKHIHSCYEQSIADTLGVVPFDVADENLQARIRGALLMYYSNKYNRLLVSTGNKSEIAVGYCTLYGDTCGGKNVPGDLYKEQIYALCEYYNKIKERDIIPRNVFLKAPSAELRANQKDTDSLPPFQELDAILFEMVENNLDVDAIVAKGISNLATVKRVEQLYMMAEYKRAQLVQTIKVSPKTFGIGRRMPILNKYCTKME
ncbi:MAG: nad+ synthetase [Promethearchaeota archaeon CR_4]|nr:MAG: nad+ synthetase [Candidatus Lokiarchaeota archaeon CR_4]